jgi:hypothetical protein
LIILNPNGTQFWRYWQSDCSLWALREKTGKILEDDFYADIRKVVSHIIFRSLTLKVSGIKLLGGCGEEIISSLLKHSEPLTAD